jgi:hypothetical protein
MHNIMRTLAALLVLTVIAAAQQPAAKPPAKSSGTTAAKPTASSTGAAGTAERHKVALELMQILLPKTHADQMIAHADQQFLYLAAADYKKRGLEIPSDFESKMKTALTGLVSDTELANWGADAYAERFTAPEMRQLITFYNTPLGKKLIKEQPEISQDTLKKLLITVDHRLPDAMRKQGLNPPPPQPASQPGGAQQAPAPGSQPAPGTQQPPQTSPPPK